VDPGRKIVRLDSRRGLTARSEHWACPTRVELVSVGVDDDLQGIGATPIPGDFSSTGLRVPTAPTVDQSHRYLFRLCGAEIPAGSGLVIRGVRQAVTIRAEYAQTNEVQVVTGIFPFEKEVTSPWWRFVDGNVSFFFRWTQQVQSVRHVFDPLQLPGTSPTTFGVDSALLYTPNALGPFVGPYVPPGAGIPPGRAVDFLSVTRELRYPWGNTDWSLSVPLTGPGVLVMYASVYQTDPATRIPPPQLTPPAPFTDPVLCGMRPEDQFLMQHPTARYGRVAGAMLLDLFPCCKDMEDAR
jgi:hypothetical protein